MRLNGKEVYRKENSNPVTFKNVIVSNSFDGYGDYLDDYVDWYDYEDYNGEFPLSDVSIKNMHLKSFEFKFNFGGMPYS